MDLGIDFDEKIDQLASIPKSIRLGVVIALLALVGAGYYFMAYEDSLAHAKQLRAESQELQRKLNKVRVVASNLVEFEQEVAELERELTVALKQLPNRKQFEDLLRDISTAGKKVGVEIKAIKRQRGKKHDFYVAVPFHLELEGTYHDIAKFFERVSRLPRIVNIGSLTIRGGAKARTGTTRLRVDGTATTFRFLTKDAESAALPLSFGSERA